MMQRVFTLVIVVLIVSAVSKRAFSQTSNSFDTLACKAWKVVAYEQDSIRYPASPDPNSDRMILYPTHKMEFIEDKHANTGAWRYDSTTKILTIIDDKFKQETKSKVLRLTHEEFIIENEDGRGKLMKMYMVPAEVK